MSDKRPKVQVAFDSREPERLAAFYASALGYRLQPPPEGFASWEEAQKKWGVPEEDWHSWAAIVDPDASGPRIFFQKMDTEKPGKNRLHLDVNASEGMKVPLEARKIQVRRHVEELKLIGATEQNEVEEDDEFWVVMLDPEGNEFCVQ